MGFYQDISNESYLTDNTDFREKAQNFYLNNERNGKSLEQLTQLEKFSEYEGLTNVELTKHENDVVEGLRDVVDAYGALAHGPSNHEEHVALGWSIHNLSQSYTQQSCSKEVSELYHAGIEVAKDILEDQIVMQTAERYAHQPHQKEASVNTTEKW